MSTGDRAQPRPATTSADDSARRRRVRGMPEASLYTRRLPVGAEVQPGGGVHFRVWAPEASEVEVVLNGDERSEHPPKAFPLDKDENGYFSGLVADAKAGTLYRYRLNGSGMLYPDPASRFQPQGPHGPSQVIDPTAFRWTDQNWRGVPKEGQVIYEMHIGTFTPEGNWEGALRELPALAELGITVLEIMPVADFPGRFGWGYDGVDLFAPTRLYGKPDEFRWFVNQAHAIGLGVILDVVYNHLGPDGNYLRAFSKDYFTDRYTNEWGDAINFDGPNCEPVRELFIANAAYWIDEFHLDGLRLDATQQICDSSKDHVLAALVRETRKAAGNRSIYLVAENEPQETHLVRPPEQGGYGLDSLWNDDFHHSAMVALTGRADAYYCDYQGKPQEFIGVAKRGYLYQGQWYKWQKKRRGTPTFDLPASAFVNYVQNHDQIANSGSGKRHHQLTSPSFYRTVTAFLLLAPQTPMLFQGQEFAASSPFFYFADHSEELARMVAKGRVEFLSQFRALATPEIQKRLPDPADPMTFARSKLDHSERQTHAEEYALHRDLLRLRREDPVFRSQRSDRVDGAILGTDQMVLRFFGDDGDDRLLVMNFGRDKALDPAPEPLLGPPLNCTWDIMWTSEDPRYGGWGMPALEVHGVWQLQGETAVVLKPHPIEERND